MQVTPTLFSELIGWLLNQKEDASEIIEKYYYACWSFVHGLISINLIGRHVPQKICEQILIESISAIIEVLIAPDKNPPENTFIEIV